MTCSLRIDTQGLLDRVFPLPDTEPISNGTASSSKELSKMYSLRTLLKEESPHPLRVIRVRIFVPHHYFLVS